MIPISCVCVVCVPVCVSLCVCPRVCVQLLLGSGVGTVRLYDTDAKKNLYEMNIDESHPRYVVASRCSLTLGQ